MKTLTERIATVERELKDILASAQMGATVLPEIGRLSMAHFFARSVVEDMRRRERRFVPLNGCERGLPVGDR